MKATMEWPGKNIPRTGIAIAITTMVMSLIIYTSSPAEQLGIYSYLASYLYS